MRLFLLTLCSFVLLANGTVNAQPQVLGPNLKNLLVSTQSDSDYCSRFPLDESCKGGSICENNPRHPSCRDELPDLCVNNPHHPSCKDDIEKLCDENPNHELCD